MQWNSGPNCRLQPAICPSANTDRGKSGSGSWSDYRCITTTSGHVGYPTPGKGRGLRVRVRLGFRARVGPVDHTLFWELVGYPTVV